MKAKVVRVSMLLNVFHLVIGSYFTDSERTACKVQEIYHRISLNCSHHNLSYIPEVENTIQSLIFGYNNLQSVTTKTFENISEPENIIEIQLDYNKIKNITSNALGMFTNVKFLYLSGNPLYYDDLRTFLGAISRLKALSQIRLSDVPTILIQSDLFALMEPNNIKDLEINVYRVHTFPMITLRNFTRLRSLHLSYDHIHKLKVSRKKYLHSLYIDHNNLKLFPTFTIGKNKSNCYFPNLKILNLQNNEIRKLRKTNLFCLKYLRSLKLGGNPIKTLTNNFLQELPNLRELQMIYIRSTYFTVESFAFNSTSLIRLSLGYGGSASEVFETCKDTFKFTVQLRYLTISRISMLQLNNQLISELLSPLSRLKDFQCFACQISYDPFVITKHLKFAHGIGLASNLITTLSRKTFSENKYLRYLNLRYNEISHLHDSALPGSLLNNLYSLDLSKNPFSCDCDLEWFITWMKIKKNSSVILKNHDEYTCLNPKEIRHTPLVGISFTYRECHPIKPLIIMAIIASPCVVVTAILTVVVYRNRWNIKHYIYLLRKRRRYQTIGGRDYVYNAFVAYEVTDSVWVRRRLLHVLEDEVGLKLCVHERDFQAGVFINDNIVKNINASEKVILLLTNRFARSAWCMFELKVAHSKHIEEETELIVILLEKIDSRNMNHSLKVLLDTTTYIEWTEDVVGQELFWRKLKDALRKK